MAWLEQELLVVKDPGWPEGGGNLSLDLLALPLADFPLVRDFSVGFRDKGRCGRGLEFRSSTATLADFAWWDHADADVRAMGKDAIPPGTAAAPFHDLEQGWEIYTFEHDGLVHVLQGPFDQDVAGRRVFTSWFRTPRAAYIAGWDSARHEARTTPGGFKDLDAALANPGMVRALRLFGQQLGILPDAIASLSGLVALEIGSCGLRTLPEAIGALKNLRWIDARFNALTVLPRSFCDLVNLEDINLAENKLQAIPACVAGMTTLTNFHIRGNHIALDDLRRLHDARPDLFSGAPWRRVAASQLPR